MGPSKVNSEILRSFNEAALASSEVAESELQETVRLIGQRIQDMVESGLPFFLSLIGEQLLGREWILQRTRGTSKAFFWIPSELNESKLVAGSPLYATIFENLEKTLRGSGIDAAKSAPRDLSGFLGAVSDVAQSHQTKGVLVLFGWDALLQGRDVGEAVRREIQRSLDEILELGREVLTGKYSGLGIIVAIPPGLTQEGPFQIRERELGDAIRIPETNEIKVLFGRILTAAYDRKKKTSIHNVVSDETLVSILSRPHKVRVLDPSRVIESLDAHRKKLTLQPMTQAVSDIVGEVVKELGISDKKTYARKRELLEKLNRMPLVDLKPPLADLLKATLDQFDSDFHAEFIAVCGENNWECEGRLPEYLVKPRAGGPAARVDVPTPYGYARIDGLQASNPYPKGIAQELLDRYRLQATGKAIGNTPETFGRMFTAELELLAAATRTDTVEIDRLVLTLAGTLIASGFRPFGPDGEPLEQMLRSMLAETMVWQEVIARGWRPEAGKMGGITKGEKRYTVFVRDSGKQEGR